MNTITTINLENNNNIDTTRNQNIQQQSTSVANYINITVIRANNCAVKTYKIAKVEIPNFVSVIKGIPTDESFNILCQHEEQELVAQNLADMLTEADYKDIRKWVIYSENYRKSPLELAVNYNNFPVCKILIKSLQPKNPSERKTLQEINNYKYYKKIDHFHEICIIKSAFLRALPLNEELAIYLFNRFNKYLYVYYKNSDYLEYFCIAIRYCDTIKIFDFLVSHIQEFLISHNKLAFKQEFIRAIFRLLINKNHEQNWKFVSHILAKILDINYTDNSKKMSNVFLETMQNRYYSREISHIFFQAVKYKYFTIAAHMLNKSYVNINTILFDKKHYRVIDNNYYTTLEILAINADAEALAWLLTIPKVTSKITNTAIISALYLAVAKKNYTTAHLLRFFSVTSSLVSLEDLPNLPLDKKVLINKIQNFLSTPQSLAKLASISLGLEYVSNSLPVETAKQDIKTKSEKLVKQENTIIDLNLDKKITSLADIFNLNLNGNKIELDT